MPGLYDELPLGPFEPLGQLCVGDDPAAAGQRLVPLGAVQGHRTDPGGNGGLLVAHHPEVLGTGVASREFLVQGTG